MAFKQQAEGDPELLPSAEVQLELKEQAKKALTGTACRQQCSSHGGTERLKLDVYDWADLAEAFCALCVQHVTELLVCCRDIIQAQSHSFDAIFAWQAFPQARQESTHTGACQEGKHCNMFDLLQHLFVMMHTACFAFPC